MTQSFFELRQKLRRQVHASFAVRAFYRDVTMAGAVEIEVKFHDKSVRFIGDNDGYASVIESVDRLIFNSEEIAAKHVPLKAKGRIILPDYDNAVFLLDNLEPADGPINITWNVTREKKLKP